MQLTKMKELRQDKGLTQAELGERCGVSRQLIGLVETGVMQSYPSLQKRIARALGVQTSVIWVPRRGDGS
jgi:DNA-binding XRE family transcriptional regulator